MNEIELTKSLINCQSVTPKNDGVLDFLENELSTIGFNCQRYKFSDDGTPDVDNLYAKFGNQEPKSNDEIQQFEILYNVTNDDDKTIASNLFSLIIS